MLKMRSPEIGEEIFEIDVSKTRTLVWRSLRIFVLMLAVAGICYWHRRPDYLVFIPFYALALAFLVWWFARELGSPKNQFATTDKAKILRVLQNSKLSVGGVIFAETDFYPRYFYKVLRISSRSLEEWTEEELGWYCATVIRRENRIDRFLTYSILCICCVWLLSAWLIESKTVFKLVMSPWIQYLLFHLLSFFTQPFGWSWKKSDEYATEIFGIEAAKSVLKKSYLFERQRASRVEKTVEADVLPFGLLEKRAAYLRIEIGEEKKFVRY